MIALTACCSGLSIRIEHIKMERYAEKRVVRNKYRVPRYAVCHYHVAAIGPYIPAQWYCLIPCSFFQIIIMSHNHPVATYEIMCIAGMIIYIGIYVYIVFINIFTVIAVYIKFLF